MCAECLGTDTKGPKGPEPLSSCNGCGMSLHSTCANNAAKNLPHTIELLKLVTKGNKWFCEECKTCDSCYNSTVDKGNCLLDCCTCHKNFHFACLNPVPDKKIKCPWR